MQCEHFLANNLPKQSEQYGWSSLEVNRCPASEFRQFVHVKHSRWNGWFLYVTPPWEMTWNLKWISLTTHRHLMLSF